MCRPRERRAEPKRNFHAAATLIAEGIEDHARGEVENLTRAIEGDELLHMTFTRGGKRYRVEMREDKCD